MKRPLVYPKSGEEDKELQQLIEFYNETLGFCPNSIKTMHHRPRIAYAFIEMNKAVMENKGHVSSALKRLIAYISSNAAGCRYCQAHAIRAAARYGAKEEQLRNIWDYKTHPAFSDAEKAALDLALTASTVPNTVTDEIAENARKYWNDGEMVEIMGVIALFGYLNRWNDSMGTEMENGAIESGESYLSSHGWEVGKHQYRKLTDIE
ncbi:MAG: carboxymuconolactone decarboxylase family protein [bacterium]|jgi:uncharacterized peroxidase-related enzyme